MKKKKNKVLVLEDDKIEALKIQKTFKIVAEHVNVVIQENGQQGINWLKNNLNDLPKYILTDINMPIMDGHEFLETIKQDPFLKLIPVIMFSTSSNDIDISKSYTNNAASYIKKPIRYDKYADIICSLNNYWIICETAH